MADLTILYQPVAVLGLSERTQKILERYGYTIVSILTACEPDDLRHVVGVDEEMIEEIEEKLGKHGLMLQGATLPHVTFRPLLYHH